MKVAREREKRESKREGMVMKKIRFLWVLILLFGLVSMSACGKPKEEPVEQPLALDIVETIVAHKAMEKKYEELEMLYERTKSREGEYIAAVRILEDANLAQGIELALLKSLEEQRAEGYEDLLNELISLRAERKDWGMLASQEYQRILEEYNELAALFPPAHFKDDKELIKWRAKTGNVTDLGCLGLQKLALADGYIVSVHPDLGYCVAIAGDYWYRITPGNKDLVEKIR